MVNKEPLLMLDPLICQQARLSRDRRFDGAFFIAVKSTGIYCRTICPARLPEEHQVSYFSCAAAAASAGYRPCLRCRPDSAPQSPAWLGTQTSLRRALTLIAQGALVQGDQAALASRLGISERYLRKLFQQYLGVSPKQYALYQQVLLAKQLLHQSHLPVHQIAALAGFHSLRRFNDAFKQQLQLSPSQIRRKKPTGPSSVLELQLSYRPPLNWQAQLDFWSERTLDGVEWVQADTYGRTFSWPTNEGVVHGWFELSPIKEGLMRLKLYWPSQQQLTSVLQRIRQLADLDANMMQIEQQLLPVFGDELEPGLRLPGLWSPFEAAVRAILGQQVSVQGARTQLNRLVAALATPLPDDPEKKLFPTPQAIVQSELLMLKIPQARRDTLKQLAQTVLTEPQSTPDDWIKLKGIGPWTVAYSKMRGLADPDCWLGGDLGVQKALKRTGDVQPEQLAPWRSYATFQLWFGLSRPASKESSR